MSDEIKADQVRRVDEWSKAGHYFMGAYYYAFDETGCEPIDRVLSAVAIAGKCAHHTESWNEHGCVEEIQREAMSAAAEIVALRARLAEVEKERIAAADLAESRFAWSHQVAERIATWLDEEACFLAQQENPYRAAAYTDRIDCMNQIAADIRSGAWKETK